MNYNIVFPGQGSQATGMGKSLFDEFPAARNVFEQADEALGFSLSDIIFNGPEEKLQETAYTQPALLTTSIAIYRTLEEILGKPLSPSYAAGHSLGEYTALVASGAVSLQDGVKLVHLRGQLMQETVPLGEGTMAAILGLSPETVESICKEVSTEKICNPANYNSPGQTVISGHTEAVAAAVELSKERGARKSVLLKVSAPFHSSLMYPVAEKLEQAASELSWTEPAFPVVANYSARPVTRKDEIIEALKEQTYNPVLWTESIDFMYGSGNTTFFEIGPGRVLSGLIKKCARDSTTMTAQDINGIFSIRDLLFKEGI